jgi:hypothetical protein
MQSRRFNREKVNESLRCAITDRRRCQELQLASGIITIKVGSNNRKEGENTTMKHLMKPKAIPHAGVAPAWGIAVRIPVGVAVAS